MARYGSAYYAAEARFALASARVVVPLIMDLVAPRSVIDVGCGVGGWLSVFADHGVQDFLGVDGAWVRPELLKIEPTRYRAVDLRKPIESQRTWDLAMSLEVAEHLPEQHAGDFVRSLTSLSKTVLLSAAIPRQGGNGHVNERWPSYWAALFSEQGYVVVDALRRRIWNAQAVNYWYCQNMLFFVDEAHLATLPKLAAERERTEPAMLDLVHPRMFMFAESAAAPRLAKRAIRSLLRTRLNRNHSGQRKASGRSQ